MSDSNSLGSVLHLLQFADSALPVGGFSFSNSLESAVAYGAVRDEHTLEAFVYAALRQAATTDCVAARVAYDGYVANRFDLIVRADRELLMRKLNTEQRQMSLRMGRKMSELAQEFVEGPQLGRWVQSILAGHVAGTHAVAQGVVCAACDVPQKDMFGAMLYGVETMMLNASLRLMRITHNATQRILYRLCERIERLYDESLSLALEDMYGFAPQIDLFSSLHERGRSRMFMN